MTLSAQWANLVDVLNTRAPRTARAIRPPADRQFVQQALTSLGVNENEDIGEFYSLQNGEDQASTEAQGQMLPETPLLSLEEVVDEWAMLTRVWERLRAADPQRYADAGDGDAGSRAAYFHQSYIPIAGSDGNYIFIDTRPGDFTGCVRSFDRDESDEDGAKWITLEDFLLDVTRSISTNSAVDGWSPSFVNGALLWNPVGASTTPLKSSLGPRPLHVPYPEPGSSELDTVRTRTVNRDLIARAVLDQARADHPGHDVVGGLPFVDDVPQIPGYVAGCSVLVEGKPVSYIAVVTESDDYFMCVRVPENGVRIVYKPR